jgi:ABC-2 type transport system ATP-binding protein
MTNRRPHPEGKIFAKGDIHRIRGLIDSHPHQVSIRTPQPPAMPGGNDSVSRHGSPRPRPDHPQPARPFFTALMGLLAESGMEADEITSPDDNLQAVFDYLIGK